MVGEDKSRGKSEGWVKGGKNGEDEKKRGKRRMIADVCQGITQQCSCVNNKTGWGL